LKIVVHSAPAADRALERFRRLSPALESAPPPAPGAPAAPAPPAAAPPTPACDVFLSYAHHDAALARVAYDTLTAANPGLTVFYHRKTLTPGASWLMEIAETLDASRRVVALYTPEYWQSPYCKDEFIAAFTRQHDTGGRILYPIFLRSVTIPYLFRSIQYDDCREDDRAKLLAACQALGAAV